ncbi:undecaprenyl/decaprenyl-phosphate alpha-N-acetylglucosaminyl 1-phosphate transferase, partial [Candidatus Sumerlaeota bacterium]|nr:undecaprenyl/decaprenyl-phosphate alpha-N-acetylglucosaminyl 1-phosphate transferase [Candidatus Sumerlaeota bacterium]
MAWPLLYLCSFSLALAMAAPLTLLARRFGVQRGILDHPDGRKAHARPIPVTGGYGIFATFMLLAGLGGWIAPLASSLVPESWDPLPHYLENLRGVRKELGAILLGSSWIFLVGLVDDIRPMGPRWKLLAQLIATLPLLGAGITIHIFLPFPILGWILTIAWTVLLMNSFNFIDNMDGLCAMVGATIAAVLAIAAYQGGELWLPALYLTLSGTLAGFLIFNFHPASIFLGDAGSLLVGYLLAVFSISTTFHQAGQPSGLPVLIPLAVMGVPLFDTASVLFIRWRAGAPFMVGDQNHFSHRLRTMGFSVRQTVITIALLTGAVGLASLPLRYLSVGAALLHLLAIVMLFGVIGALEF